MSRIPGRARIRRILAVLLAAVPAAAGAAGAPAAASAQSEGREIRLAQSSGSASGSGADASQEAILIGGEVIEGGVVCPLFRTDDGREFTLFGFDPHLPAGTRMRLRGHVMRVSTCRQGVSFRAVERLE